MDVTGDPAGHSGHSRAAHIDAAVRMQHAGRSQDDISYFGRLFENSIASGVHPGIQEAARREYKMMLDDVAKLPPTPPVDAEGLQALVRALDAKADPNAVNRPLIGAGSFGKFSDS